MITGLVISVVKSLNNEIRVSKLLSEYAPQTLVTGYDVPNYNQLMGLTFGDHVEVKNYERKDQLHQVMYNTGSSIVPIW